ncbi:uncharacterized protein [Amphiura filiformis]|uniref:uncharacterized protein isoform X4 n=1 Tax=Amphiura filiformis TaxID=82378 RepID=UPI003B21F5C8
MKMNLVVLVAGIFIMFCNSVNSESVDCIALCNECVAVSDTLTHMGCTKHCEELTQRDNGKMSCTKLTALNKGSLSLEEEINSINARMSELIESDDISAIFDEFLADDYTYVVNGQAPAFGKEDVMQQWFVWFKSNPSVNRVLYTPSAFGENNGNVWEDGIVNIYQDDALIGSCRYMHVYKRVNGTLLRYIEIYW